MNTNTYNIYIYIYYVCVCVSVDGWAAMIHHVTVPHDVTTPQTYNNVPHLPNQGPRCGEE